MMLDRVDGLSERKWIWPSDTMVHCPYKLILAYLALRPELNTEEKPLFIFRDGVAVTGEQYRRVVHATLKSLGLNPMLYDTHSFHIGQATDLQKLGLSLETIKIQVKKEKLPSCCFRVTEPKVLILKPVPKLECTKTDDTKIFLRHHFNRGVKKNKKITKKIKLKKRSGSLSSFLLQIWMCSE